MDRLTSNIWFCLTVVFGICLLTFAFPDIILHPAHVITEPTGDGGKNNFTYLYQCLWGHGYWFDGMNYPYGEHIVYTDAQPVISVPLSYFKHVTVGEALSVMWLLISFSYLLCLLFIYKILTDFRVAPFIAMLFAGLITIFSPQLFRLQGHYALSYACLIPMLFYWTIKYNRHFSWRYPVYFFITGCIVSFLHPYYAGIMLVWVIAFATGCLIFTKDSFLHRLKHSLPLVVSVILVIATVAIIMRATDPVTDRPVSPYNTFYEGCTHIKQLITSEHSPLWLTTNGKRRFHFVGETGEGYGYPGIVAVITVAMSLVISLWSTIRKKQIAIVNDTPVFAPIWLFMAFVSVLVGMGVPFIWHMQWLFDYFSFFRQFRCLGRFIWIFYYIVTIYAVVALYAVYTRYLAKRKFFAGYAILVLSLGIWSYEASGYINFSRKLSSRGLHNYGVIFSAGKQNWQAFLGGHHYNAADFQAILVLPFFHWGTEKLGLSDPTWLITAGSQAALQLHLPIVDAMMSRSSWSQAMGQVKIAAGPYAEKPLLHDLKSNKPFLLVHFEHTPLNPDQKYLLDASDYIGHYWQCQVYACYPDRIAANDKRNADRVEKILPFMKQADTVIASNGVVYLNHYDESKDNLHFFGTGGGPLIHREDSVLTIIPMNVATRDSALYECSCWFLAGDMNARMPSVTLQLLNDSGRVIGTSEALASVSTDNNGLWFRASTYFYVHADCRNIRCLLINKPEPAYLAMDEILLRPADALIISKSTDGKIMVNNHLFKR